MFLIFQNSFLTIKGPRCFLKRKGSFHPPANSKVKEARTMKLCTVIVYYIVSIIKQLKFLNSHYSIVCSHCSIICLVIKNGSKNGRIFKFFDSYENEIRIVDNPFNEDFKKFFPREA